MIQTEGKYELVTYTLDEFLINKGYCRIRLSVNSLGHFEVDGSINSVKAKFILDTGASGTVINETDISHFNLQTVTTDDDKAAGLGSTTMTVQKSKGNRIELRDFVIEDWQVGIIHLGHVNEALENKGSAQVNGVIGADILNRFEAVIDYGTASLYLRRMDHKELD